MRIYDLGDFMVSGKKTKIDRIIRERKLFQQQAHLYRNLMEAMREGLPRDEIFKSIISVATRGLGYDTIGRGYSWWIRTTKRPNWPWESTPREGTKSMPIT
jgi:hypothetical protein